MIISNSSPNVKSNNPSFKSIANPIKPFKIKTTLGELSVREFNPADLSDENFVKDFLMFSYKNFASYTRDPFWLSFNDVKKKAMWEDILSGHAATLTNQLKSNDKNLTLLLARDESKQIRAACLSYGYKEIPNADKDVCYIDSLAVDKELRGQHIGKILVEKTLESARNAFTDVFLVGEVLADKFYKKLGFVNLDPKRVNQRLLINKIADVRFDFPEYVEFLTKPLQLDKPRWYDNPIHRETPRCSFWG